MELSDFSISMLDRSFHKRRESHALKWIVAAFVVVALVAWAESNFVGV